MSDKLNVMSTLAVEKALKAVLLPAWEQKQPPAEMDWQPTTQLVEQITAGARADVLLLIDKPMAGFAAAGVVEPDSVRPLATASIGVGQARGGPVRDISDMNAFRQLLLDAPSIAYSRTGASGIYFAGLIEKMGIADEVNAKAVITPGGFTAQRIIAGEAEIAIQQISELLSVDDIEVIGPLPDEVQVTTDFSAAIFAGCPNRDLARSFIEHLTDDAARDAYAANGMAPRF